MADIENQAEETELVDISEVSDNLPVVADKEDEPSSDAYLERRSTIATLKERFAAFFIDSLIFFYSYFAIGYLCRRAFYGTWDGAIPSFGWQGVAVNSVFLFFVFMYYFIFEGVFFATPGKFFCWMYVRKRDGSFPSLSNIFIRTVFRTIDYALPLIPFFMMELTRKHQRLGDFLAGTTVIKKHPLEQSHYNITMANIASASGRIISFFIDAVFVGSLTFGYLLLLSPDSAGISRWLLLLSPLVPFLFFVITEPLTGATPGKWVMGYTICHDDGFRVSLSGSIARTLLRVVDTNPLGLLSIWISPKKQRFGDLAGDTVITRQKREWPGLISLAVWAIISALVLWLGVQNKSNFLSSQFRFNFLPVLEIMGNIAEDSAYKELTITHIRFAADDPSKIRTPSIFRPGETVYIITDIYGYEKSGRLVWLQEDLEIKYPDGSIGLHQENIIDYHQVISSKGPIELTNSIQLPENAQSGQYVVTITVRDLFAHERKIEQQIFDVKGEPPSPSPALP